MTGAYALNIASSVSDVFPVLAALINYKRLDKVLKITGAFFLVSCLFDLALEIMKMKSMNVHNDLPAIHLFIVISILFFAAIYYHAFVGRLLKKTALILSALALLLVVFNAVFIEGIWEYPSMSNTVLSVLVIFFSLAYFYQLLSRQEFIHIEKQGLFWINAGVLFYYAINLFLFMLFSSIMKTHEAQDYYMIHIITNILANILFIVGLLCRPQKIT